jgi:hypothetical protein
VRHLEDHRQPVERVLGEVLGLLLSPLSKVTLRDAQSNSRPSAAAFGLRSTKRCGRRPSLVTVPRLS